MNAPEPRYAPGAVYRRLLRYVRPHWRMYVWGVLGIASAAIFVFVRVPSHAVTIDLPIAATP